MKEAVGCDDDLIPQGHEARAVWAVVEALDLAEFHKPIPFGSAQSL